MTAHDPNAGNRQLGVKDLAPIAPTPHQAPDLSSLKVRWATTFWARLRGLLGHPKLKNDEGLLIRPCHSVHTVGMGYNLDVVYLDAQDQVTQIVPALAPWRMSAGPKGTKQTLELAAGTASRLGLQKGQNLSQLLSRQRGATMVEFAVVGPMVAFLGFAIIQYGLLFFAKNQVNHATFMAAREGTVAHADMGAISTAYSKALIPMYGGGLSESELAKTLTEKVMPEVAAHSLIEIMNPTKESFDDFNVPQLQNSFGAKYAKDKARESAVRVIPFTGAGSFYGADGQDNDIKANSGQNRQDALLLKLRITHGYKPIVPLVGLVFQKYLQWQDRAEGTKQGKFHTALIAAGRIPIVSHVTLRMQSDAVEPVNAFSSPGQGNGGNPSDPGAPSPNPNGPPKCATVGCTVDVVPVTPPCDRATDPKACVPDGCQQGDASCDPGCGKDYCCTG